MNLLLYFPGDTLVTTIEATDVELGFLDFEIVSGDPSQQVKQFHEKILTLNNSNYGPECSAISRKVSQVSLNIFGELSEYVPSGA